MEKYKDKDYLIKNYLELKKPMKQIADELRVNETTVKRYIHLFNIRVRSHSEIFKGRKILWGNKISKTRKKRIAEGKIKGYWEGKRLPLSTRKKISLSRTGKKYPRLSAIKKVQNKGKGNPNYGKRGKNASGWKGDKCITPFHSRIRDLRVYKDWSRKILERDNYICQICGKRSGDKNVHHIKKFSLILKENKIKTIEQAINCKELWDINNGITLCRSCHKKVHTKPYLVIIAKRANSGDAEKPIPS